MPRPLVSRPPSNVARLRPSLTARTPDPHPFDWQADEDGPLTSLDALVAITAMEQHAEQCVRDAARKLRRHLRTEGYVLDGTAIAWAAAS